MNLEDELSKLRTFKKNSHYRIGDLLLHSGDRWHIDRQKVILDPKYNDTLLCKYFHEFKVDYHMWRLNMLRYSARQARLMSRWKGDRFLKDFKSIIDENPLNVPENELLIHIRCGDIVSAKCLDYQSCHIFHINKLIKKIKEYAETGIKKITLIAAMHYGSDDLILGRYFWTQEKHQENLRLLSILLEQISQSFKIPVGVDFSNCTDLQFIDNQFLKLIHAKNVILDKSGFSKVIEKIRESQ